MTPIEPAMSQKSALKIYRDLRFGCSFDFCMPYELCMSENATLLLNLTPDNTGRLPDEQVATMHRVAELIRNPKSNADKESPIRARSFRCELGAGNLAHRQPCVVPFAVEPGRFWITDKDPIHTEIRFESLEVAQFEILPADLCLGLLFPVAAQLWHLGDYCWILNHVGEHAPLRQGAKAVVVLTGSGEVSGVQSEVGVDWSIVADPCERLKPRVCRARAREFEVRSGGEQSAL